MAKVSVPKNAPLSRWGVVQWSPEAEALINRNKAGNRKVYLTLQTETTYGRPGKFKWLPRNWNQVRRVEQLAELPGSTIVGSKVKEKFSLLIVLEGTGAVTSVPSDSPSDYQTLMDPHEKPEFSKIDASCAAVGPIPVPVISIPTYGDMTAPAIVKQLKIQSQKYAKQLSEAKEIAYKEGFYNSKMIVGECRGEYKGEPVWEAKVKVRNSTLKTGLAFAYADPEGFVLSRSADECVVALYGSVVFGLWRA
ncbi:hypothetical protein H1R20_g9676, partial [Candolleomyces eurysporus]